jgi:hypothetical protein
MALTLEQLDQRLAEWRQKIDCISQNLIDLHGLSTYQRLTDSPLAGLTQVKVGPVLIAMADLFQQLDLLIGVIDRATQLRKQVPRWMASEQQLLEIENLLLGPSIQFATMPVPLGQRGLLTAVESQSVMTPEQLLHIMTVAFEQAKQIVLQIEAAWSTLEAQLAQAERQLAGWGQDSANLGAIAAALAKLRDQLATDPLGAKECFEDQIAPAIAQLQITREQTQRQQAEVQAQLQQAQNRLAQLQELRQRAIATYQESQAKVSQVTVQPALAQENLDALSSWLARLAAKLTPDNAPAIRVGLENWLVKAKAYIALEERAIKVNNQPLATRRELRGRLAALQAKALARGSIEDPTLTQLAIQAKQLLSTRPTPLNEAMRLVIDYEKRINHR